MDTLLIAGLRLDGSAWDDVVRRDAAIPVPEGMAKGVVRLADERRFDADPADRFADLAAALFGHPVSAP
jgi:hypothetical protein